MVRELYEALTECAQKLAGLAEDSEHMCFDGYVDVLVITPDDDRGTFVDVTLTRTVGGETKFHHITSLDGGETWCDGPEALS